MTESRAERVALIALLAIFAAFTWRAVTMFYSGDDMMNMYGAWEMNGVRLAEAVLLPWIPLYRPVGAAVYRTFYELTGFHPQALYTFCWLLLLLNIVVAYSLFRSLTQHVATALTAVALMLLHGSFGDLYYSAGTIYDRLCFLFIASSLICYFRFRRRPGWKPFAALCLCTVLAMGSKETAIAIGPLIVLCELIFFLPQVLHAGQFSLWIRQTFMPLLLPLYITVALLSILFLTGRIGNTPEFQASGPYHPHWDLHVWLEHLGYYFGKLLYHAKPMAPRVTGLVVACMGVAALVMRNRCMVFGWLFFLITVTPVALISVRYGYVLYVPAIGLSLFLAAFLFGLARPLSRAVPIANAVLFLLVAAGALWAYAKHPATPFTIVGSPEYRLTQQFRREYPTLPRNIAFLFTSDPFPPMAYDLLFNLRLLYHDKTIMADRMMGAPNQQPKLNLHRRYDHVFASEDGRYVELDPNDPAESIRLHILRNYAVGYAMDISRPDHSAYVVSGLRDGNSKDPSRWTASNARFKFNVPVEPRVLKAKFWVPDFVSKPANRTLTILVNGRQINSVALSKDGMQDLQIPVPAEFISPQGYTFLDMNVSNAYKDAGGNDFGIILLRAAFEPAKVL